MSINKNGGREANMCDTFQSFIAQFRFLDVSREGNKDGYRLFDGNCKHTT
jgi:hypothetical protein